MSRYAYGYCGMPCALCTRCRTEGSSRCPGCSCDGYYTVPLQGPPAASGKRDWTTADSAGTSPARSWGRWGISGTWIRAA